MAEIQNPESRLWIFKQIVGWNRDEIEETDDESALSVCFNDQKARSMKMFSLNHSLEIAIQSY